MIGLEEFVERLCVLAGSEGTRPFPRRRRDREILLKSIRMLVEPERTYTELEINALLQEWGRNVAPAIASDHVTVRRLMVDHGELERTADGSAYRLGFPVRPVAFELGVDDVDVRATIAAYREREQRRRAESAKRRAPDPS